MSLLVDESNSGFGEILTFIVASISLQFVKDRPKSARLLLKSTFFIICEGYDNIKYEFKLIHLRSLQEDVHYDLDLLRYVRMRRFRVVIAASIEAH